VCGQVRTGPTGWHLPPSVKRKGFGRETHSRRSWSAYNALQHVYRQSAAPAVPALAYPPPVMTTSSTESVSATGPPAVVRPHVASTHTERMQMALLIVMFTPDQIVHLGASSMVHQDYHATILRNAFIYMRSDLKSVSGPQIRRSSRWISSSVWPLFFFLDL